MVTIFSTPAPVYSTSGSFPEPRQDIIAPAAQTLWVLVCHFAHGSLLPSIFPGLSAQRAIMLWFVTLGSRRQTVNQGQATGCLHSRPNYSPLRGMQCPGVESAACWRIQRQPIHLQLSLSPRLHTNQNKNTMMLSTPPTRVLSEGLACACVWLLT